MDKFLKPLAIGIGAFAILAAPATSAKEENKEEAATAPEDQVICRRVKTTGSNVARHKVCATRAQWAAAREARRKEDRNGLDRVMEGVAVDNNDHGDH